MIELTRSGVQSLRKFYGVNKKSCERLAVKAKFEGIPQEECSGYLRRWLDSKIFLYNRLSESRSYVVFGIYVFVYTYDQDVFITAFTLPYDLHKQAIRQMRKWKAIV